MATKPWYSSFQGAGMDRREFILAASAAVALLAVPGTGHAECGGETATNFVETLYQKQARLQAERAPLSTQEFEALFSRSMRNLMRTSRRYRKNAPLGPVLNAFFGWGVLPGTEVAIQKVTFVDGDDAGPATIRVTIEHHGQPHNILVRVASEHDEYRIANISYDSGLSLAGHYRALTGR